MPKPTIEQLREMFPLMADDRALTSPFAHLGSLIAAHVADDRTRMSLAVIEDALMEWAHTSRFLVVTAAGETVIRANSRDEAERYQKVMPGSRVIDVLLPSVSEGVAA